MTTGMSAPPIGSTIVTPKTSPERTTTASTTSVVVLPSVIWWPRRVIAPPGAEAELVLTVHPVRVLE